MTIFGAKQPEKSRIIFMIDSFSWPEATLIVLEGDFSLKGWF